MTSVAIDENKKSYERLYSLEEAFLRYPADWVIRFHNMYLKEHLPKGSKVLDYGCGCGNNAVFLMQKGYEVHGVDVARNFKDLLARNLEMYNLDPSHLGHFQVIDPDIGTLPFEAASFDFIISNQVLYYLLSEEKIRTICKELDRCLKPGGTVFFTMLGPRNYYITHHAKAIQGDVFEVRIETPGHRLEGHKEFVYLVPDEDALVRLFDQFEPLTTGFFEQKMLDMPSNMHWIFAGKKRSAIRQAVRAR